MNGSTNPNIAYQPIGFRVTPKNIVEGDAQTLLDQEDDDGRDCDEDVLFSLDERDHQRSKPLSSSSSFRGITLRQLRTILLVVATLLFLTFLAQLVTNHDRLEIRLSRTVADQTADPYTYSMNNQIDSIHLESALSTSDHVKSTPRSPKLSHDPRTSPQDLIITKKESQYDTYLSSVLRDYGSLNDQSAMSIQDDLTYPDEYNSGNTSSKHHNRKKWWQLKFALNKQYAILENYIRATKSFMINASITLTTQATTDFIYHTVELCKRWDGPISVAVFAPGPELPIALTIIKFMRQCLPEPLSACIRDKVTWHLVYNKRHGPPAQAISFPRFQMDDNNYSLFIQTGHCPKLASGPNDIDMVKQFEVELRKKNQIYPQTYRQKFQLVYPINVLRNTARVSAHTKYVLASDIELYPSANMVPQFINMLRNHDLRREFPQLKESTPYIFALPIFEIRSNVTKWPKTKQELIRLIESNDAIFFHKWVCDACQNFPNRLQWLEKDTLLNNISHEHQSGEEELQIFELTRRDKNLEFWEPIFIGTNNDPQYDDRLSWDGRRDKMGQMYEMCLQGYQILVLGNAFLVHAPGIKHLNRKDFTSRMDYIRQNNVIYDDRVSKLREQYKFSDEVKDC